uniref:Immunoglobulin C1-set domain-containing protein n=1 Tax=Naja naja TaxID=35670 RepID=A0A8C6X1J9_NAJNA
MGESLKEAPPLSFSPCPPDPSPASLPSSLGLKSPLPPPGVPSFRISPTTLPSSVGPLPTWKHKCRFLNGMQWVRFLLRWNNDKKFLQYTKAQVDSVTHLTTAVIHLTTVARKVPTVTISRTKMDLAFHNTLLLCTWLKNSRLEEEGMAFREELQNGDWTYQLQVMLDTQPQQGDIYACQVGHASLEAPITIQWEPHSSSSARNKLWTGIMGSMIGVAFLAVGLFSYLKSKKGESGRLEESLWGGKHLGEASHQA